MSDARTRARDANHPSTWGDPEWDETAYREEQSRVVSLEEHTRLHAGDECPLCGGEIVQRWVGTTGLWCDNCRAVPK